MRACCGVEVNISFSVPGRPRQEGEAGLHVVLQVLAHPWQIMGDFDAKLAQFGGRPDAGVHQQHGELMAPAETITSRRARICLVTPRSSTSTPTARRPSNRMRRTKLCVMSLRFLRARLGLR